MTNNGLTALLALAFALLALHFHDVGGIMAGERCGCHEVPNVQATQTED